MTIFDWFGYELPQVERYRLIRSAGFTGVLLWWSDEFDQHYRDAPEVARRAGLFVENIHTPFAGINSLWLDNLDGEAFAARLLQCVEDCAEFEIPTMVVHLSSGATPPPMNDLGLGRIRRIADLAERRGVNIAFENLRKTEYLDYVLGRLDSPRIGLCYDSGHHNCYTPGEDLLGQYGSRLMALHLHDNDGSDDQHLLPFEGTVRWESILPQIAGTGYRGALSLEAMNEGHQTLPAEEFLRLAYARAEKLEALLRC